MKLAYITTYNVFEESSWPRDRVGFHSAGQYIARYLENCSIYIDYLGPLRQKRSLSTWVKGGLYNHLFGKKYYNWANPTIVENYATQVSTKLSILKSNIIFCPENVVPIAFLDCKQPIVLWTDSTLASLIGFYPSLFNICKETARNIYKMEKAALNKCSLAIYTSDWAAQTAVRTYGIDVSKVKVIPWGANIECSRNFNDILAMVESRTQSPCKLLFFGVDWLRKGGNIALKIAKLLNKLGLNTELTIVGCQPITSEPLPQFVKPVGYIDKSKNEGLEKINKLLASSHFLLLPSQAETYGHVFCEANSFGVPCISTDIGGVSTIIKNDLNGKLFSKDSTIAEYSTYILNMFLDYSQYKKLAVSSFNEYETRLCWSVSVQAMKKLFIDLV